MKPRVAVVIPLYNHERYIASAIESALNQTVMPARIIVIDDGSSDGSVAAARSVAHPNVEIHEQPNQGAHAALNRGVGLAEDCEFVAILNSDDLHHTKRYEVCLGELAAEPTIQIVCTEFDLVDTNTQPLPMEHPRSKWFAAAWSPLRNPPPLMEWLGLANFPGTTSNFFARREWLRQHPFRDYRYAHDYYHLLEAALFNVLKIIPGRLLSYRIHESNTISTRPSDLIREMLRMNADFLRAYPPRDGTGIHAIRDYLRASWNNVSAFRQDLFTFLLCRAFASSSPTAVEAWIDEVAALPEAAEFPNRHAVNELAEGEILGFGLALAEKLEETKKTYAALKEEYRRAQSELRLAEQRLASRKDALRRLLGQKRR
jgi:glycosyltransferase involved in cell wall biosynthesis